MVEVVLKDLEEIFKYTTIFSIIVEQDKINLSAKILFIIMYIFLNNWIFNDLIIIVYLKIELGI